MLASRAPMSSPPHIPPVELPGLPEQAFYTVQQVADWLQLSHEKTRLMFRAEPGVLLIEGEGVGARRRRKYATIRIPRIVVERFYRRTRVL